MKLHYTTLLLSLSASLVADEAKPQPAAKPQPVVPAAVPTFNAPEQLQLDQTENEGPTLTDFDSDGLVDIISGNYGGNLFFRKNIGTKQAPKFAPKKKLTLNASTEIKLKHW